VLIKNVVTDYQKNISIVKCNLGVWHFKYEKYAKLRIKDSVTVLSPANVLPLKMVSFEFI